MSQPTTVFLEHIELLIEWRDLAKTIRSGKLPNAQHLLVRYMSLSEEITKNSDKTSQQWVYREALKCLEETICDTLISPTWRYACADYLYRPIQALAKAAKDKKDKDEFRILSRQAYQQCRYFLCSSPYHIHI